MTIEEAERIVSHPGWKARRIGVDCARPLQRLLFPAGGAKPGPQRALIGRFNHTSSLRHAASKLALIAPQLPEPVTPTGRKVRQSSRWSRPSSDLVSAQRRKITMKRLLVCTGLFIAAATLFAQQTPPPTPPATPPETVAPQSPPAIPPATVAEQGPPKSPPATESGTIGAKAITITYSSPKVNGRAGKIFTKDGLISHDAHYPVWRAGANAATKLHTDAALDITGLKVPKGDYTLFVDITDPDNWVLIVNKQTGQWGLAYDKAQDLGQVKMTMEKQPAPVENLKYTIKDLSGNKGALTLVWENLSGSVPISVQC